MPATIRPSIDLADDVFPLSEFRGKLTECIARTRRPLRPVLIAQNGKSASVLLSVEDFERLRETFEPFEDVRAAEAKIERSETFSTPEVEAYLKKKRK